MSGTLPATCWHCRVRAGARACCLKHEALGSQGIDQAGHHIGPPAVHIFGDAWPARWAWVGSWSSHRAGMPQAACGQPVDANACSEALLRHVLPPLLHGPPAHPPSLSTMTSEAPACRQRCARRIAQDTSVVPSAPSSAGGVSPPAPNWMPTCQGRQPAGHAGLWSGWPCLHLGATSLAHAGEPVQLGCPPLGCEHQPVLAVLTSGFGRSPALCTSSTRRTWARRGSSRAGPKKNGNALPAHSRRETHTTIPESGQSLHGCGMGLQTH